MEEKDLATQWKEEGFQKGFEAGVKFAFNHIVSLIYNSNIHVLEIINLLNNYKKK